MVGRRVGRADCHETTILEEFRVTFSSKNRFIVVILGALSSFGLFLCLVLKVGQYIIAMILILN